LGITVTPFSADAHRIEDILWYKIAKHLADWFTVVSTDLRVTAEDREAHVNYAFRAMLQHNLEVIW
jgi:hypothetical protein